MNYLSPIYTELTECQDCYKCIRQCPVKAIRVENGHATILSQMCILCGNCVIHCPANAKHIRDDLGKAKQLLTLKESPENIEQLIDNKKYFAGYHMNKKTWYTIHLDGSVAIEEIYERIDRSYNILMNKKKN